MYSWHEERKEAAVDFQSLQRCPAAMTDWIVLSRAAKVVQAHADKPDETSIQIRESE
jgi:hypothetical protein